MTNPTEHRTTGEIIDRLRALEAHANELDRLCEVMHDTYEHAAADAGWETNPASRTPWGDVPDANKFAMRTAVRALLAALEPADGRVVPDPTDPRTDLALASLLAEEVRTEDSMTADYFMRQVERVIERIEQVAQQVRSEARVGSSGYTNAAANMVHALQWGVANVPLESLLRAAADADRARRADQ